MRGMTNTNAIDEPIAWTTEGSVRGSCGHRHRTEDAADACIAIDDRGCKRGNGYNSYSDRRIVPIYGAGATSIDTTSYGRYIVDY